MTRHPVRSPALDKVIVGTTVVVVGKIFIVVYVVRLDEVAMKQIMVGGRLEVIDGGTSISSLMADRDKSNHTRRMNNRIQPQTKPRASVEQQPASMQAEIGQV